MQEEFEALIGDIFEVAVSCRLADANARERILEMMPGQVVARFPLMKRPDEQLHSDLISLWNAWSNEVVGVERGLYEPPLATWLHEACKWVSLPNDRQRLADLRERALAAQDTLKAVQDRLARAVAEAEDRYGRMSHSRLIKIPAVAAEHSSYIQAKRKLKSTRLHPGAFIADRFRIHELIGRGSAEVWRAFDAHMCRYVALKVLAPRGQFTGGYRDRFVRGAECMRDLGHQNVVTVFDIVLKSSYGQPFYSMEYHPAGDIQRLLRTRRRTPSECLDIVLSAAEGLAAAHDRGFVHRDVKPPNILMKSDGLGCLTDFDLVWSLLTSGGTRTGAIGTPDYLAPEMRHHVDRCEPTADVYSLGMTVAYVANHGNLPGWMYHNRDHFLRAIPASDAVKNVLYRATAIDPAKRPRDARAFVDAMQGAFREGLPLTDGPPVGDRPPTGVGLGQVDSVDHYLKILADRNMPPGTDLGFERNLENPELRPLFSRVLEEHYRREGNQGGLERVLRARLQDLTQGEQQAEIWLEIARIKHDTSDTEGAFGAYEEAFRCLPQRLDLVDTLSELADQLQSGPADTTFLSRFVNLLEQHLDRVVDASTASAIRRCLIARQMILVKQCRETADQVEVLHDLARHHKALMDWSSLCTVWRRLIKLTEGTNQQVLRTQLAYLLEVCDDPAVADPEAALHMYGTLLREDPDHRTSLERLQDLYTREDLRHMAGRRLEAHYRRVDDWPACIRLLKDRASRANSTEDLRDAHLELARVHLSQFGDVEQALTDAENAFLVEPGHAGARANFYAIAAEMGAEDRVRIALRHALDGETSSEARLALLMRLIRLAHDDPRQRRSYLDMALEEQPAKRWVLAFLAQAYGVLGAREQQCRALELRLPLISDRNEKARAIVMLAKAYIEDERPLEGSLRALEQVWEDGVRAPSVAETVGWILIAQATEFEDWLSDSVIPEKRQLLGLAHLAQNPELSLGSRDAAFEALAHLPADDVGVDFVAAAFLARAGRWAQASNHLERVDHRHLPRRRQIEVLQLLGHVSEETGEFHRAVEAYEAALEAEPAGLEIAARLANLYEQTGQRRKLQGLLEELVERQPSASLQIRMSDNSWHLGRKDDALRHARSAMYSGVLTHDVLQVLLGCLKKMGAWQDYLIVVHRCVSEDLIANAILADPDWVEPVCAALKEQYDSIAVAWPTVRLLSQVARRRNLTQAGLETLRRYADLASREEPELAFLALEFLLTWDESDVERRYRFVDLCLRAGRLEAAQAQLKHLEVERKELGVTNRWVTLQARALLLEGRGDEALALTTGLLVSPGQHQGPRALHAWALLRTGRWEEAHRVLVGESGSPSGSRSQHSMEHPLRGLNEADIRLDFGSNWPD